MIIDIFKYYAGFPKQDGVTSLFVSGRSENNTYKQLLQELQESAIHSRLPEIDHYVFGGSYEAVKTYIDNLSGIYLFVEFGEFSSTRQRGSIHDTFRIAVTIAGKKNDQTDLVELALLSDQTLRLIHRLRVLQFTDQAKHPWLKEISDQHSIHPFEFKDFDSTGWTILFNREGTDMLGLNDELRKHNTF
ncbi:MAG: hypothetical protein LUG98_09445 [Tannerellaceae bacterium]|nr:hypothetical protein [Tannerellaceae bacterium]